METKITGKDISDAVKIAKDLRYDAELIKRLKKAKTIGELNRIMAEGRERI